MVSQSPPRIEYRCSFCRKDQKDVRRLIAGPGGVYICNECIALCNDILAGMTTEEALAKRAASPDDALTNARLRADLDALRAELAQHLRGH